MATVKDRQRARRERLAAQGLKEISLTVPQGHAERLRTVAEALRSGHPVAARLLPALRALQTAKHRSSISRCRPRGGVREYRAR